MRGHNLESCRTRWAGIKQSVFPHPQHPCPLSPYLKFEAMSEGEPAPGLLIWEHTPIWGKCYPRLSRDRDGRHDCMHFHYWDPRSGTHDWLFPEIAGSLKMDTSLGTTTIQQGSPNFSYTFWVCSPLNGCCPFGFALKPPQNEVP